MLDKLFGTPKKTDSTNREVDEINAALDRYDRIFKGSRGYGFVDLDLSTGRAHWHGGFWSHLGYDERDIVKIAKAEQFLSFVHPHDRDLLSEDIVKMLKEHAPKDLTFRVRKSNDQYIWVELRVDAVRKSNGWVSHLSGVVFDVSALKETEQALLVSEARHARIIQAANDGIWEWSSEHGGKRMGLSSDGAWDWSQHAGGFTFSDRCWEMLGYAGDHEIVKGGLLSWREIMHADDGKRFDEMLSAHIFKRATFDIEYRIRGRDGEWRWLRGRGQMAYDEEGKPSMMSGTNMDITELKRAEERVMGAKEEAEKASQAKSEFLSSMSHELRTPLNAILGFAQLFELDPNLDRQQKDNIQEIKVAGKHLLELVGDVLDLAKIEAGHMKLTLERVLPSRLINECVSLLKSQMEDRELSIEVNFNDLETQTVMADVVRLKQVFLNLIGNAIKYNVSGGSITIDCVAAGNGKMRIIVEDSGRGIPLHLQSELFQPFNRLGAETSGIEGSGVGLVITKQLVEQMGGDIGYESEEKVGSKFWTEFSLSTSNIADNMRIEKFDETKVIIDDVLPELLIASSKRILYVEDNPSNQKLMQQLLAKFPVLDLTVVGLAVQGLYEARSTRPDLVILDVNLPGINGYEIVEILKKDPQTRDIPVIALSANVLSHDIEKGRSSGFDHYLTKPLNLGHLLSICNELLA